MNDDREGQSKRPTLLAFVVRILVASLVLQPLARLQRIEI